uniref:hypothetical protein n=1 Tax=Pararhizobium sp. IMCC3301 TaxID=3067904 RepID=UPI0027407F4D|nr:hypothetical protein [Pararhizobium sp. IMCC3301]
MSELYTASQMHDAYCRASGLSPKDQDSILNRFRYMAKRGLLGEGIVVDDRKTLAFPKIEIFRASIYTELAGIAMDLRAFEPIVEAAERRYPHGLNVAPSMKRDGAWASKGGLLDAIHGVALGENWSLQIELKRPGFHTGGGLAAEFVFDASKEPPSVLATSDEILGRRRVRTRASVDLYALFAPLIELVGLPG